MALILIISLAACGPSTTSETSSEEPADSAQTSEQTDASDGASGNVLVVFFSRTGEQYQVGEIDKGNTAIVAEMIAEEPALTHLRSCLRKTTTHTLMMS